MTDVSQRIADLSPEKREILLHRLKTRKNQQDISLQGKEQEQRKVPPLQAYNRSGYVTSHFPLSFAQQRLWFLDQLEPGSTAYLLPSVYRTRGRLDVQCFRKSLQELIRRHESLRTTFVIESAPDANPQPVQVIHPVGSEQASCPLPVIDLQGLLSEQRETEARRLADIEIQRPCDLVRGPLLRAYLFRLAIQEHVFVLTQHHIITDGWSMGVLMSELRTLYDSFVAGQPSPLAPLPIQYADYALWQRQWLQGEVLSTQLTYWKKQLADVSGRGPAPSLQLPTDHVRPAMQTYHGATQVLICPPALSEAVMTIGRQENVTLFMVLLAAFQVLLARYTGQSDISVGTPIANRRHAEIEGVIGFFVNTLVMRTDLSGNPTFLELLHRVREVCLEAYAHQDIPIEKIVEELEPERDLSHPPLFQVMLVLLNTPTEGGMMPVQDLAGVSIVPFEVVGTTSRFDLTLFLTETAQGLHCILEYNTDLFEADTIRRWLTNFQTLLEGVIQSPQAHISDLPLLTEAEQEQILAQGTGPTVEWHATQTDYPQDQCIHQLFEQQVERTPDSVALACGEDHILTYTELNRRANQLAHYLQVLGVGPEICVGICMERSIEMVVGLLGALKAGGAYVPLDPTLPQQRLAHMIQDAQVAVLLTQSHLRERLSTESITIIAVDMELEGHENNLANVTQPDHLLYMIYTSGSTGRPKGVLATHQATLNRLQWTWATFPFAADEICSQKTSLSFVDAVWEIFGPLLRGIRLVLIADETLKDTQQFITTLTREQITRIVLVPSLLRILLNSAIDLEHELPHLKYWTSSGEALSVDLALLFENRLPQRVLLNLYGSSEVAGDATYYDSREGNKLLAYKEHPYVPIGHPIANTQLYILDPQRQPVPIGVTGELYIAGSGLARGYKNRPDLTAERFIPHPSALTGRHFEERDNPVGTALTYHDRHQNEKPLSAPAYHALPTGTRHSPVRAGERLYQTGDLARYLPDGTIEYLGRIDGQVKLRGFRIELGEIEATLRAHPAVQEAVIVLREEDEDNKVLVAYVVTHAGSSLEPSQMQEYLRERLPDYMVPTFVVELPTLPLTPNGKVDRKALPSVDSTLHREHKTAVAPSTALQELLAGIWKEVLHLQEIGIYDNFFALGGHSLLATQVIGRICQAFEVNLPLRNLFEVPTIARLSQRLEQVMHGIPSTLAPNQRLRPIERPVDLPLSFAQERLWFLNQWESESAWYNVPMVFRLEGSLDVGILERSLAAVVQRHEVLRSTIAEHRERLVQVIAPTLSIQMPVIDLRGLALAERDQQVSELQRLEAGRSFDLVNGPLLRVRLLRTGKCPVPTDEQEHVLLFTMHHIVTDGWSTGVLIREITILYQAEMNGEAGSALPELPIQYADYALWQRSFLQGEVLDAQMAYWRKQLADLSPLELPTDHVRPAVKTEKGASQSRLLPKALADGLQRLCQKHDVTLFMLLLGTFQVMLMRYTRQTDISIGTPVANRTQPELEGLIGFFVNTLVLRTDLSGNPTFLELLRSVREVCLGAYAHQDIPFEKVVEESEPERDMSRSPLFQVMLILQNTPVAQADLAGVTITPLAVETTTSKFDLTLSVVETAQGLNCVLEYSTDLFNASTITRMLTHCQSLLEGVLQNPQANLSDLSLLTEAEREQVLAQGTGPTVQWNATQTDYSQHLCIHQHFEQQAEQTPDSIALIFAEQHVTYQQLNSQANQLAHRLLREGIGPEVRVGVYMQRSPELVTALLAVLKAAGAYVPLDPELPQERLNFLLEDAQVAVVLTQESLMGRTPAPQTVKTICVACESFNSQQVLDNDNPHVWVHPENLAYLIYTSGSTGRPKGAMGTHRASLNRFQWMWQTYPFSQEDICCQKTNLSFVDAVWEIFGPLLQGIPLVIIADEAVKDPFRLRILLERHAVTRIVLVPSLLHVLLEDEKDLQTQFRRLTYWVSSGEPLTLDLAQRFAQSLPTKTLINLYGSSEVTADVTCYEVGSCDQKSSIPIGRPIANTQVYLLDSALQLVPIGMPGEVYIGGANLTRGYWQRADLTAERFLPHPFAHPHPSVGTGHSPIHAGARLYRTGDLARALPNGTLEFLGRADQQVKIRGHRIELAEIEATLLRHPALEKAVVLAQDMASPHPSSSHNETESHVEGGGGLDRPRSPATQLVAYLVTKPNQRRSQQPSHNTTKELQFSLFYFANDALEAGAAATSTSKKRYKLLLEGAKFADTHNFTAVWTPERHFHPFGGLYPNPSVTSAAIAAVTQKVQIRAGSVVLPLHDPLRVAEEWAVVDNLSDGRIGISFATGWIPNDFVLAPEHYTKRKEIMMEKIETFRKLWRGEAITLPAPMGNTVPTKIYPQPIQSDLPIWLTSSGNPETFRQAGEIGMNLLTHLLGQNIDELAEKIALYRQTRQEHGHSDPGHVTLMLHTFIGTESAAVREKVRQPFSNYLRSSVGLIETLAQSLGYTDLKNLTADDLEVILEHAFDRYYETSGLMGTVSTCLPMVERLKEIDVDEVACLIDFGVDEDEVLASLHELVKLKEEANQKHTIETIAEERGMELSGVGSDVEGTIPSAPAIRSYLQEQLPSYMVPTLFVQLDALPLLPNGKVDRKALPTPNSVGAGLVPDPSVSTEMALPQTPLQEQLALIWAELLHLPQVSIHENFFELGGHSLLAMQVITRMRGLARESALNTLPTGVDLPLRSLFEHPTITSLTTHLEGIIQELPSIETRALVPMARPSDLPLSFAQERLWFLHQWEPDSAWYNVPMAFRLSGPLHLKALERSLARVVQRHEVLRTTFEERAGIPFQIIIPCLPIQMPVIDLHSLPTAERDRQVTQLARAEGQQPFNLANGPLLRIRLLKLTPMASSPLEVAGIRTGFVGTRTGECPVPTASQECVLLLTLHHIVSDITSTRVLANEMVTLYHSEINDEPSVVGTGHSPVSVPTTTTLVPILPELPIQYADYALWQRQWLQGEVLDTQITYWKQQLAGIPAQLKLPTDRPRPAVQSTAGARVSLLLPVELQQQLKALSLREGATLFMTGLAAFNVLLYYYTGQDDLVVGTDVANRNQIETEHLIGFFVNQLLLRMDLSGNPSFVEVMHRVRKVSLEAYAHQDLPFDRLVKALNPERNLSHTPLFQVKFLFQNAAVRQLQTYRLQETLKVEPLEFDPGTSQLDLLLNMSDSADGLSLWLEYPTDLFNAETMTRFLQQFEQIIRQIVALPESRLESIQQVLAAADREEDARREQELQQVSLQKLGQLKRRRNIKKVGLN